jgi:hypothetical protein
MGRIEYRTEATMVGSDPIPTRGMSNTNNAISGMVSTIFSTLRKGFAILGWKNMNIPILIPMTVAAKSAMLNIERCSTVRTVNNWLSQISENLSMIFSTIPLP